MESNEAVAVADSSTVSTDVDRVSSSPLTSHTQVSQRPTTRNRLLMQLLAGTTLTDAGAVSRTTTVSHGVSTTSQSDSVTASARSSQSVRATTEIVLTTASNELSEDLNSVNVTDLFTVDGLLPAAETGSRGTSDAEDQLLMAQLEQAIMNSELSLEDLDCLLAVSSTTSTIPVAVSSASTPNVNTLADKQRHSAALGGISDFSLPLALYQSISGNL